MKAKFTGAVKIHGKTIIHGDVAVYNKVHAEFFPNSRYPGGIGGQTWRVLDVAGPINGKPSYVYGDESITWTNNRWEMNNAYQGTISYSPEDVQYPYLVNQWYYGASLIASDVTVYGV